MLHSDFIYLNSILLQWFVPRSHLHTGRGSRGPLVRALLGCPNHGKFLLVSAVAVRHNSSQVGFSKGVVLQWQSISATSFTLFH